MGGSHMGKVMSDYFKISGPDSGPDCGILKLISTFKSGSN
jgi:hypothetical protein